MPWHCQMHPSRFVGRFNFFWKTIGPGIAGVSFLAAGVLNCAGVPGAFGRRSKSSRGLPQSKPGGSVPGPSSRPLPTNREASGLTLRAPPPRRSETRNLPTRSPASLHCGSGPEDGRRVAVPGRAAQDTVFFDARILFRTGQLFAGVLGIQPRAIPVRTPFPQVAARS